MTNIAKKNAAEAVLAYIEPNMNLGIGTGTTADFFIDCLATIKHDVGFTVASSHASKERLESNGIEVKELNLAGVLDLYIDGADEFDPYLNLIKGAGGALTREKIVAAASDKFICIVDESKQVDVLGSCPLPVEVLPMARSFVARKLVGLGGKPEYRKDFISDNGNVILDVFGLEIMEPLNLEHVINQIPGVICCGIFAAQSADIVIVGNEVSYEIVHTKK